MKKQDVVTLLANRLGKRTDMLDTIRLELQLAQENDLELNGRFRPWFLLSEFAYVTVIVDEQRLPLPTDFLQEYDDGTLWIWNEASGDWDRMEKKSFEVLEDLYGTDKGVPAYYSLDNQYFNLWPIPSDEYRLRMRYYQRDDSFLELPDVQENRWLKNIPNLLMAQAGVRLAGQHLQDTELASKFQAEIGPQWDNLFTTHEAQKHINREYVMGGEN